MNIQLNKFGTMLISRPAGKEAFLALQPLLKEAGPAEKLKVDFDGVAVLAPAWADEFLTPLFKQYPGRVDLEKAKSQYDNRV